MAHLLHDLLKRTAQRYPQKTAVSCNDEKISYRELDSLSDKLCFCLLSQGAQPGGRIGIYLDKSIAAVAAIFAVLKTGSCYVPLDPLAPAQRQIGLIDDCAIEYLITSSKKISQLNQILKNSDSLKCILMVDISQKECREVLPAVRVIFKDEILRSEKILFPIGIDQGKDTDLGYILYTSGSTGSPKGVMVSHKASLAFIDWAFEYFNVDVSDNVSAQAPFHFDLSVFDIFVSVKAAATIHIVPEGVSILPKSLADFIEKKNISVWYSVPSLLIQLVLYGGLEKRNLSSLRHVIFAGEVFPIKYLRQLMQAVPRAKYCNLYGPTETNVCTYYSIRSLSQADIPIPIGKPCEGTSIFLVTETGRLANRGELGELLVSGPTLMDGYWNTPQKTQDVLLVDFIYLKGTKVYRSGDWVRINEEGDLEYHGRRDNMIKSRGYRIELGEIEAVLLAHPGINEAAVIGVSDEKIGKKIKAVVVPGEGSSVGEDDIKFICSQKLPAYMVPETVIFKKSLPKTSSNKIDRKCLEMEGT